MRLVSFYCIVKRFLQRQSLDIARIEPRPQWPEETSRFAYQKLFNDFDISTDSVVLDIGSGAYSFPLATIFTDRFLETTPHRSEDIVLDQRPFLLSCSNHISLAPRLQRWLEDLLKKPSRVVL
jgi:hypothetical protein